ncbi:TIR domain-containing protein [Archangium violaceum]|uniref:TIR domain-containing protein n=1 Tax=Archangium violaceum TaxID=83451 RepID=UPI0036D8F879
MSGEARNLFITQADWDDAELQGLKNLLRGNGYELQDSSIAGSKPNEATNEQYLAPRIDRADVVLVLISPVAHAQPQVDWAIEYAQQQDKRIVGVYVQGGTESDLPASFQMYADALVDCQAARVVDAIEGRLDTLLMPDGETEFPARDIDRWACGESEPE